MTIMPEESNPTGNRQTISTFVDFLFEGLQGYVYLAAKPDRNDPNSWEQEFFDWPLERNKLVDTITHAGQKIDVYLSPVLYSERSSKREHVKVTQTVWTEFDGNAPESWGEFLNGDCPPTLTVQSSDPTRQHVYWRLAEPLFGASSIEEITRRITYYTGADGSAWDANQVLRPPGTRNFKYENESVFVLSFDPKKYTYEVFLDLGSLPTSIPVEQWQLSELPSASEVLLRHSFSEDLVQLLQKDKTSVGDRSSALMQLAYGCAQLGLKDNEIFVVLMYADDNWGKFKGRRDREKRLAHIITVARNKYPDSNTDESSDDEVVLAWDYQSFLNSEIEINWALEPMIMEYGNMLLAGPSGVGKTQIFLDIMTHLALGKDWLHYKVHRPYRILFLSLEMGHPDLQVFVKQQAKNLTDAERDILARNFIIVPHGEPMPLNTGVGQAQLVRLIEQFKPDGIFVDSIGSAIVGDINASKVVQTFTAFNDAIRKRYGVFLSFIHHTRKKQQGASSTEGNDEIYGDQYLVNRSSSVYQVRPGRNKNTLRIINSKQRLASTEDPYYIGRTDNLTFVKLNQEVDNLIDNIYDNTPVGKDEQDDGFVSSNGIEF